MSVSKLLNEYQAAARVGMSPTLLRWFTTHAPKSGESRKLKFAKEDKGTIFFEEQELLAFNEWLRLPWPHPPGKRPGIPAGIKREIKVEANGACAVCQSHGDSCEAAHLDPVAKTECNHPEGLLWLCANHHTKYDNDRYGPANESVDFIKSLKIVLHRHKRMLWVMQDEVGRKLLLVLDACESLDEELANAKTAAQKKTISFLAQDALAQLPKLAPVSHADPHYEAYKTISPQLLSLTSDEHKKATLSARLKKAKKIKRSYIAALGYVPCPLCKASGFYDGTDCPVCGGDREIEEKIADEVDLTDFQKVQCPLCKGAGKRGGVDCPECGGDGEMQRRFACYVDLGQYEDVECPLCDGSGKHDGDDCRECGGEGKMPRNAAQQVDVRQYEMVACPLCDGSKKYDGDDCPECSGEGELPRNAADQVDLRQYMKVKCPLCKGRGQFDGDDCPECQAEGEMTRGQADQIDLGQYKLVTCPACKGRYDDCGFCDGKGEVYRGAADRFDPSGYN
jgi:hypothetical protein